MTKDRKIRMLTETSVERVVPMGDRLEADVTLLKRALSLGLPAVEDPKRKGFYTVECRDTAWYVNLHEASRTAYILGRVERPELHSEIWKPVESALSPCSP